MKSCGVLLFCCFVYDSTAIKMYQSDVLIFQDDIISGLFYKKQVEENVTLSKSMTICVRFDIERLSHLANI